jgi:transposase
MKDTDLYQHVLGLREPWSVCKVQVDVKAQRVDVWVEHPKDLKWPCPECEVEGALHDHGEERLWRHLDTCQFRTFLHARPPRVNCPGLNRMPDSPCSLSGSRSSCWSRRPSRPPLGFCA